MERGWFSRYTVGTKNGGITRGSQHIHVERWVIWLHGRLQQLAGPEPVSQKIKPLFCFTNVTLVRMDAQLESLKNALHPLNLRPEPVSCAGKENIIIYEVLVGG